MLLQGRWQGLPTATFDLKSRTADRKAIQARRLLRTHREAKLQTRGARQQQEESAETSNQVSEAGDTADKVRSFLGSSQQQHSDSKNEASLPAAEDVVSFCQVLGLGRQNLAYLCHKLTSLRLCSLQPDRAKQAGISPWVLGGAGLIAVTGLALGLTTVGTGSVSTLAESSQGGCRLL